MEKKERVCMRVRDKMCFVGNRKSEAERMLVCKRERERERERERSRMCLCGKEKE
jgi:hypothetical protein